MENKLKITDIGGATDEELQSWIGGLKFDIQQRENENAIAQRKVSLYEAELERRELERLGVTLKKGDKLIVTQSLFIHRRRCGGWPTGEDGSVKQGEECKVLDVSLYHNQVYGSVEFMAGSTGHIPLDVLQDMRAAYLESGEAQS